MYKTAEEHQVIILSVCSFSQADADTKAVTMAERVFWMDHYINLSNASLAKQRQALSLLAYMCGCV